MKLVEVKKGENYNRGRVLMAIHGTEAELDLISTLLKDSDYATSSDCREKEEQEGIYSDSYGVDRCNLAAFRAEWKEVKAKVVAAMKAPKANIPSTPAVSPVEPFKAVNNANVSPVVEAVVERSSAIPATSTSTFKQQMKTVSVSAVMNFCSVSREEAINLLRRSNGSVIDAARLHKADIAKIPPKPKDKPVKAVKSSIPPKPEIVSNLDLFGKRSGLIERFVSSTGEANSVAVDYLEDAKWVVEEAIATYQEDQKACSKANKILPVAKQNH